MDQPFFFLGKGGWCFAFIGQDQKTVLKFYKYSNPLNRESTSLLYTKAKKESALLYTHLDKTDQELSSITLYDPIGIQYTLDLNQTAFVIQEKATPLLPTIESWIQQGREDLAKEGITSLLHLLHDLYSQGIDDLDEGLRKNYGFIGTQAIVIDISSFVFKPELIGLGSYREKIAKKTHRLAHFLHKYHPELYPEYDARIALL